MEELSRRRFLGKALATGAVATFGGAVINRGAIGANDRVNVAIVGVRGKGAHHIKIFSKIPGVRVAAICDVDTAMLDREEQKIKEQGGSVKRYTDVRKLLEDKDIDAIAIATPNHWHSLIAIWGCQAGKDVYVEKPVSHNVWEGRKIVEAARKYNRIVQTGTQSRSDEALHQVFAYLREGHLGEIKLARGLCYKRRKSIGLVDGPQPIPPTVNYDLWTGPAPLVPLRRERLHYDWHWQWPTGNGDIGNQGIHEMDMCRWALGQKGLPKRVLSIGGRFGYVDDGTTANTQIAYYDYEPAPLIFEVRGLPRRAGENAMGHYRGVRIGIVIHCEGGYFAGGAGGGWLYDNKGKKIRQFTSPGGGGHQANFIEAVRSRKREMLAADIEEGHISSALCHLGNISYRLGQKASPDEIVTAIEPLPWLGGTFARFQAHLAMNDVDLMETRAVLGPMLEFDPQKERFVEGKDFDMAFWANRMLRDSYRDPFVVPEKV